MGILWLGISQIPNSMWNQIVLSLGGHWALNMTGALLQTHPELFQDPWRLLEQHPQPQKRLQTLPETLMFLSRTSEAIEKPEETVCSLYGPQKNLMRQLEHSYGHLQRLQVGPTFQHESRGATLWRHTDAKSVDKEGPPLIHYIAFCFFFAKVI